MNPDDLRRRKPRKLAAAFAAVAVALSTLILPAFTAPAQAASNPAMSLPQSGPIDQAVDGLYIRMATGHDIVETMLFPVFTQHGDTPQQYSYCAEYYVPFLFSRDGMMMGPGNWNGGAGNPDIKNKLTDPSVRAKVAWIGDHAYPGVSLAQLQTAAGVTGLTIPEAIAAGQAAIWATTDTADEDGTGAALALQNVYNGDRASSAVSTAVRNRVLAVYNYLVTNASPTRPAPQPPVLTVTNPAAGQAGHRIGPMRVTSSSTPVAGTVTGAYPLVTSDGTPVDLAAIPTGVDLFVDVPAGAAAGEVEVRMAIEETNTGNFFATMGDNDSGSVTYNHGQLVMISGSEHVNATATFTWEAAPELTPDGPEIPMTGGTGTALLIGGGLGVLALAAATFLVGRKRKQGAGNDDQQAEQE